MKLTKRKRLIPFCAIIVAMILVLGSCKKEDTSPIVLVPTVTSVTPTSGEIGDEITITGTNFNTAAKYNEVKIGGVATIATASTSTTLTANVPSGAKNGIVDLVVKAYGVTTDAIDFTVIWPPPELSNCVPGYGYATDTIAINGVNFSTDVSDVSVTFGGIAATVLDAAGTTITVKVPAGVTTGNVVVTIAGQVSNGVKFFVPINPATVSYLIGPSADDVEESVTRGDGHTESGSGGLNFGRWDEYQDPDIGKVLVGVRHPVVEVPQGATIISAYLQCEVYATGSLPTQMTIYADYSDSAIEFDEATFLYGVSSRTKTPTGVVWDIPEWLILAERGPDQRTPDLRAMIQEIVDRPGWASGNSMAFMLEPTGPSSDPQLGDDTAGRIANGGTDDGPSLVIIYEQ